jgi:RNA polymerase-binding transcription factor
MRHHFHRCTNLRVVSIPAAEIHGARRGAGIVVEELCEAKRLTPCVGLAECDILTAGQKQELLVERATRIREQKGRPTELSGVSKERAEEIDRLRQELVRDWDAIVEENIRLEAEIAGAEDRELLAGADQAGDLEAAGLSLQRDPAWSALRIERLDELDRALAAMEDRAYGTCALCGGEIPIERLRLYAETRVCTTCAQEAPAPHPISGGDAPRRMPGARRRGPGAAPPPPPSTRSRS